jgi:hypothetical protein
MKSKNNHGGARPGAGIRKNPVEPKIVVTAAITKEVKDLCQQKHGSFAKALIYASKARVKPK